MKKILKIIVILILIIISLFLLVVSSGYKMYAEALQQVSLEDKVQSIRDKETYTKIEDLPKTYLNAVISVEDHRFYNHSGIDIIAIGRAAINDIRAMSLVEGGSTITQQLAKNLFFTQDKVMERKIAEVFMAWKIESIYSKDDILELYVNTSYFGDGYYSVKEACRGYFNKEPKDMTDYECMLLAGIPNAPSIYAPTKNPVLARQRQEQVRNKMIKYGYISE